MVQRLEEALLAGTLTREDLSGSTKSKVPAGTSPLATDAEIMGLSDKLKEAGHIGVMEDVFYYNQILLLPMKSRVYVLPLLIIAASIFIKAMESLE